MMQLSVRWKEWDQISPHMGLWSGGVKKNTKTCLIHTPWLRPRLKTQSLQVVREWKTFHPCPSMPIHFVWNPEALQWNQCPWGFWGHVYIIIFYIYIYINYNMKNWTHCHLHNESTSLLQNFPRIKWGMTGHIILLTFIAGKIKFIPWIPLNYHNLSLEHPTRVPLSPTKIPSKSPLNPSEIPWKSPSRQCRA
jgi:hypothetical protein